MSSRQMLSRFVPKFKGWLQQLRHHDGSTIPDDTIQLVVSAVNEACQEDQKNNAGVAFAAGVASALMEIKSE